MTTPWDLEETNAYVKRRLSELASVRPDLAARLGSAYFSARDFEELDNLAFEIEREANNAAGAIHKAARKRGFGW